jgi:phosphopantothenoylcysteine decarboxylase/phosphopantothenate--cysteine ligase
MTGATSTTDSVRKNRRILVGVTGGIAAYKSPDLVRRLMERGADVRVVMTVAATEFITPLTLQAVSGHPVYQHLLDTDAESGMGHIELARWAEMIVVAPATANFMAKVASGRADDLLSTLVVASGAELILAPAMNQQMWQNRATQENLQTLVDRGIRIIGPGDGDQACGEVGPGRMTEPVQIAEQLLGDGMPRLYAGTRLLITAGPTWEAIDPVRGITNHSSGKMGYAMAQAALDYGADVTLVSGPVSLAPPHGVSCIHVRSTRQMLDAVMAEISGADIFIAVAAVADYRPARAAAQKIKKKDESMTIELVRNPDILAQVAAIENGPFTIGFAAETEQLLANAQAKLEAKKLDVIIANDVSGDDSAFGNDTNAVTLIHKDGSMSFDRSDKYGLSAEILESVHPLYLSTQ